MPRRPSALCSDAMPASLENEKILIDQISCTINQLVYKHWFHHPSGEWIRQPDHVLTWIEHPVELVEEIHCNKIYWTKFNPKFDPEFDHEFYQEKKIEINIFVGNIQYIILYSIEKINIIVTENYKDFTNKQEELTNN